MCVWVGGWVGWWVGVWAWVEAQVSAKVRLLGYLNPQSPLFFDAKQLAVTISDYTLSMSKVTAGTKQAEEEEEEEKGEE